MPQPGANLAVTEDGAAYNKLRRPDDYLESLTAQHPPKSELPPAKRKFEAVAAADLDGDEEPTTKRSREENAPRATAIPGRALARDTRHVERPAKENGMQTMFPGLDDDSASDADDTTREALAYLRSVRSEASTIPTLLVAPPQAPKNGERDRSTYNDGVGDHRVRFHEGTWVAVDDDADRGYYDEDDEWSQHDDIDPQAAYYNSLLRRYTALRNRLANADPRELAALVKADPEKYANVRVPYYKSDWRYAFDNKYPTPALIAQLDDKGLYRALEYVSEVLIIGDTISKQKSCWIWTLLALAGDSGTLDYYKVGRIRELGHKAGQLSIRLRSGERRDAHRLEEGDDAEQWEVEGEGDEEEVEFDGEPEARETPSAPQEQRQGVKGGEVVEVEEDYEPPLDIGGHFDGAAEQQTQAPPAQPANKGHEDDMSSSEDEGEIKDDDAEEDTPADLEAARARLLAQLGDNLVTDSIPDLKVPAHQLREKQQAHGEQRQNGRHRHNGKWCKDPSCQMSKARQEAHRRAALRATQGAKTNGSSPATPSQAKESMKPTQTTQRQEEQPAKQPKRSHEQALAEARKQAVGLPEDTDPATFLASLDPELRRAVLADQDVSLLAKLPPEIAAEARYYNGVNDVSEQQSEQESSRDLDSEGKNAKEVDVDLNTRVTIDTILTVVGECYGQRDLLRYREAW
ncbi:hypothetical protein P171DRAFT_525835 [Karstenula rhodostoma CBS 690.94]|uniref:Uncharacterized protein n=1 Tax=Karstenula rhodostoma CBS 690.94 TaxID=1392251 RepID=A0A9P4U634_9PLEO|nr:hypothetical protein P171DRAFT_525835 [Karstenula rhodostoma CBS 690.94]